MIELVAFDVFYNKQQILYSISAGFRSNSITAIIGPSGCGKTTVLKAINRMAELQQGFFCKGKILLAGKDIYSYADPAAIRQEIGLVLQKPVAFPLSIKENILFGPRYYGKHTRLELEAITETTLTKVGLWNEVKDKLNSPANELSGGQLQRLSIGRVLAVNPKVLLLDEPCSSLDIRSTRAIEELLLDLKKQLTIIIVTHNLTQAKRVATDTVFMTDGRVIEANRTGEIFANPQQVETKEFMTY